MSSFLNYTATTEIYTLSLHDALPISDGAIVCGLLSGHTNRDLVTSADFARLADSDVAFENDLRVVELAPRSEEHTSELQSRQYLVCRLLLEKKRTDYTPTILKLTWTF